MLGTNDGNGRLGSNQFGSLERSRYPKSLVSHKKLEFERDERTDNFFPTTRDSSVDETNLFRLLWAEFSSRQSPFANCTVVPYDFPNSSKSSNICGETNINLL